MIPKIIHYCWFSNDSKPRLINKCIDSWKKYLPEYTIKCWDGNSFDFKSTIWTKQAMEIKKYAYASDYVRLYALYNEGGIYLDSDVELRSSLNPMLNNQFFSGYDIDVNHGGKCNIEAGIMGSEKGHPFIKECMQLYQGKQLLKNGVFPNDGSIIMPSIITPIAEKYGYQYKDIEQIIAEGMHFYPRTIFINGSYLSYETYEFPSSIVGIHHNISMWEDFEHRGRLFHLARKYDFMKTYKSIEKIIQNLKNK